MTQEPKAVKFLLPQCEEESYSKNLALHTAESVIVLENCQNEILTVQSSIKFNAQAAKSEESSFLSSSFAQYLPQIVFVGALIVTGVY